MTSRQYFQPRSRGVTHLKSKTEAADLRSVATYIGGAGALVAAIGFLAIYFSWSFARGFLVALNLPTVLIPFSRGFEVFPQVGIQLVALDLLLVLCTTFILWRLRSIRALLPGATRTQTGHPWVAITLLPVLFGYGLSLVPPKAPSVGYTSILTILGIIAPAILLLVWDNRPVGMGGRWLFLLGIAGLIILFQAQAMDINARFSAANTENFFPATLGAPSIHTTNGLPYADVLSDVALGFETQPVVADGKFHYVTDTGSSIQLLYLDPGNNYYFLERTPGSSKVIGVKAGDIIELQYLDAP